MTGDPIDLEDLITLIREHWKQRYVRGRILHVHKNAIRLANGRIIHLRVLVQELSNSEYESAHTGGADVSAL